MVEVKNLIKKYGNKTAVNNISFTVDDGEVLGLLGPNGAGKSTTMNIITGYLSSNSGEVFIDGYEIFKNPIQAKSRIGYLPEQPPLYLDMTVSSYLKFMFDLKKVKLPKDEHIHDVCEAVGITDVSNKIIKHLSKGYKQRVGLAQALLGNPKLIILDEPTVGLDPNQIIEIRSLIKDLSKEHTVILSSHILAEIQAVCDRVILINNGKVIADDTPEHLSSSANKEALLLCQIEGNKTVILDLLANIDGINDVNVTREIENNIFEYIIKFDSSTDIRRDVFFEMAKNSTPILCMKQESSSLEEAFIKLTQSPTDTNNDYEVEDDSEPVIEKMPKQGDNEDLENNDTQEGKEL